MIKPYVIKHRTPYWEFTFPTYEAETTQWYLDHIQADWVCLDGGANVGYFTILFSRLAPKGRVIAVEPTDLMEHLRANCREAGCQNVVFVPVALGASNGLLHDGIHKIWGEPMDIQFYPFCKLDTLLSEFTRLDLLKLDLDSYEHEALIGAQETLKRFNPFIVVELNFALKERNSSAEQVVSILNSWGYKQVGYTDENYIFKKP